MRHGIVILGLVLTLGTSSRGEQPGAGLDQVAEAVATAGAASSTAEQRREAVAFLRRAAAGPRDEPATRESMFALAYLLSRDGQSRSSIDAMLSATTLYPDDPRASAMLRRLFLDQMSSGDRLGAHLTFTRLSRTDPALDNPVLLARAAANAAEMGDMAAAFEWSTSIDPSEIDEGSRVDAALARLISAVSLGQPAVALEAIAELEAAGPENLHGSPAALLAAARVEQSEERDREAAGHYQTFVNIYPRSPDRPGAMLELGRLFHRIERPQAARVVLDSLVESYPASEEGELARLDRIDLDAGLTGRGRMDALRAVAESAGSVRAAEEAFRRLLGACLEAATPLECLSLLGRLALQADDRVVGAARRVLSEQRCEILEPLIEQGDDVGLAAASLELSSLALEVPDDLAARVRLSRQRLGLPSAHTDVLDELIRTARGHARSGRWDEVRLTLEPFRTDTRKDAGRYAVVTRWLAEARWRDGHPDEALTMIADALELDPPPSRARALHVLRADILFVEGRRPESCRDYRRASAIGSTRWVDRQVRSCDPEPGVSESPS